MNKNNPRDYGGINPTSVIGKPTAKPIEDSVVLDAIAAEGGCPHCGCTTIFEIEVEVTMPQLKGGKGVGRYLGCPACPWASPMLTVAKGVEMPVSAIWANLQ